MSHTLFLSNRWVLQMIMQVCVLVVSSIICDQAFASASSVLASLKSSDAKGKLKTFESKEMHGCFFADDEYDCPWTQEGWKRILDVVIGLASDPNPRVRESVVRYMHVSTDARIVKPLGRMLMGPDLGVRRAAVGSFVTISLGDHDAHIVRQIEHLLDDEWPSVRSGAAAALITNGTRQSLEKLEKAYRREADQGVRVTMAEAITQLERR